MYIQHLAVGLLSSIMVHHGPVIRDHPRLVFESKLYKLISNGVASPFVLAFSCRKKVAEFYLVGGFKHLDYFPWYMGCHPSHWLSYFSRWFKPPTSYGLKSLNCLWQIQLQLMGFINQHKPTNITGGAPSCSWWFSRNFKTLTHDYTP